MLAPDPPSDLALPSGRCGVAEHPVDELGAAVVAAWDAFLDVVTDPGTDLGRPSRLRGWSGRDTCVHLGSWPQARVLDGVLDEASGLALRGTFVVDKDGRVVYKVVNAIPDARDLDEVKAVLAGL